MQSTDRSPLGQTPGADKVDDGSPGRNRYGAPIGMLLLEDNYPSGLAGTPGTIRTSDVPVRCRVVDGCTVDRLIYEGDDGLEEPMVAAARKLVDEGARAITSNCGFMIRHQAAVSNAVDVPVLLSSLLLAPLLLACMGGSRKLGIVTASRASLTEELLGRAGVSNPQRVVLGDLADQPVFRAAILERTGEYDMSAIETELVNVTGALVGKHPDIGAVLFECVGLPPYAATVQRSVGVPVFDSARLIDLFAAGFAPPGAQRLLLDGMGVAWLSATL